jgi:hypothetical protein
MRRWQRDESLPSPEDRELALLLARKAESDEAILDKLLDDVDIPDDALGFHAQQAIEMTLAFSLNARTKCAWPAVMVKRSSWTGWMCSVISPPGLLCQLKRTTSSPSPGAERCTGSSRR